MPKQHCLCSYDIRDKKRLAQVHQCLSMLGIALNYSVFYLHIETKKLTQLQQQVEKIIRANDDVRFYACESLPQFEQLAQHQQWVV